MRRRVLTSLAAGFAITLLILALEAHRHNDFVALLQYPGFLAAAEIWGVHSDNYGMLVVLVLVNTLVYGLLVFAASMLIHLGRKASSRY